jgi:hypothetical protein
VRWPSLLGNTQDIHACPMKQTLHKIESAVGMVFAMLMWSVVFLLSGAGSALLVFGDKQGLILWLMPIVFLSTLLTGLPHLARLFTGVMRGPSGVPAALEAARSIRTSWRAWRRALAVTWLLPAVGLAIAMVLFLEHRRPDTVKNVVAYQIFVGLTTLVYWAAAHVLMIGLVACFGLSLEQLERAWRGRMILHVLFSAATLATAMWWRSST